MVIRSIIANADVGRVLVDQGSSVDILYQKCFEQMNLQKTNLIPYNGNLVSFSRNRIQPLGYVETRLILGDDQGCKMVKA